MFAVLVDSYAVLSVQCHARNVTFPHIMSSKNIDVLH